MIALQRNRCVYVARRFISVVVFLVVSVSLSPHFVTRLLLAVLVSFPSISVGCNACRLVYNQSSKSGVFRTALWKKFSSRPAYQQVCSSVVCGCVSWILCFAADFKQLHAPSTSASSSVTVTASDSAVTVQSQSPAAADSEADVKAPLASSQSLSNQPSSLGSMPEVSLQSHSQSNPASNFNVGASASDADRSSVAVLEESMPTQRPGACKQIVAIMRKNLLLASKEKKTWIFKIVRPFHILYLTLVSWLSVAFGFLVLGVSSQDRRLPPSTALPWWMEPI